MHPELLGCEHGRAARCGRREEPSPNQPITNDRHSARSSAPEARCREIHFHEVELLLPGLALRAGKGLCALPCALACRCADRLEHDLPKDATTTGTPRVPSRRHFSDDGSRRAGQVGNVAREL